MEVDHYAVLGLPSGIAGAKLSQKEITKAYKSKALELHPDKRRDDPNAHNKFQKLQNSYDILKDKNTRQVYDDLVRREPEVVLRDLTREKMMEDLWKKEMMAWEEEERRRRRMQMMVEIAVPVICVFCLLAMIPVRMEVTTSTLGTKVVTTSMLGIKTTSTISRVRFS